MKLKKLGSFVIAGIVALSVVGCGSKKAADDNKIVVGASAVPHAEILNEVKPLLKKKGYDLEVKVFDDYVLPNTGVQEGSLDANFFQHIPYLEQTNKEKKYDLDYTVKVHIEPMGLYSKKVTKLDAIKSGAEIAIPSDASNKARALLLLQENKVIKLKNNENPTVQDITENTKNLKFKELDAAQLPTALPDVDAAVINTNYALQAKLNPTKDAIIIESSNSPYANILAVKKSNKDSKKIKALSEALNSKEVKDFIEKKYKGSIVPAF